MVRANAQDINSLRIFHAQRINYNAVYACIKNYVKPEKRVLVH